MSNIQMTKGDTQKFDVYVTRFDSSSGEDVPVNLDNAKAWFTAKKNTSDDDTDAIIAKNSEDNPTDIVISTLTSAVRVTLVPEDTESYDGKWLMYDVQIREDDGAVTTIERGKLELIRDVTITRT